jgi:hypothetical protein
MLGRSLGSQDFARLTTLAPDWLESNARAYLIPFGKEGAIARQDMARITAYTYAAARIANLVSTGKPHFESPFGGAVPDGKGGEKIYSVRTLPTDFLHAISDPREYIMGRVNPLTVRTGIEAATGRNEQGQRVTGSQEIGDLVKNTTPIPLQGFSRPDLSTPDQITKAAGFTVTPYRTVAEKLAGQLASDRGSTGPVDRSELAKHQARIQMEDSLRMGHASPDDVKALYRQGKLSEQDANSIVANGKKTALQARFERLPMKDALQVYDVATSKEKAELAPSLMKKRAAFLKDMYKTHSYQEIQSDPIVRTLMTLVPQQ